MINRLANLRIGTKLIVTFIVAVGLTILVTIAVIAVIILVVLPQWFDQDITGLLNSIQASQLATRQAELVGQAIEEGMVSADIHSLAIPTSLHEGQRVFVVTKNGNTLVDSRQEEGREVTGEQALTWLAANGSTPEGLNAITQPIVVDHSLWGYYVVELNEPLAVSGHLDMLLPWILISGPIFALILSLLLFWWFGLHLVTPIKIISRVVGRIAAGELASRVSLGGRRDEIGKLAQDIDGMADKLQAAKEQAERTARAHRYLTAAGSHDLRSPLTAILAHAEALQNGVCSDPQGSLTIIREKGMVISDLVSDLLELASLEASDGNWDFRKVDLAELIRHTVIGFLPALEAEGVEVDIAISEDSQWVNAVPEKLQRVFDNILSNVLKYGASGKWLGVRLFKRQNHYRVEITDHGPGIAQDEQERIFERFYRNDQSRKSTVRGVGLGLAIAKEIVVKHNGVIGVSTPPTGGAEFWVEIPSSR